MSSWMLMEHRMRGYDPLMEHSMRGMNPLMEHNMRVRTLLTLPIQKVKSVLPALEHGLIWVSS